MTCMGLLGFTNTHDIFVGVDTAGVCPCARVCVRVCIETERKERGMGVRRTRTEESCVATL